MTKPRLFRKRLLIERIQHDQTANDLYRRLLKDVGRTADEILSDDFTARWPDGDHLGARWAGAGRSSDGELKFCGHDMLRVADGRVLEYWAASSLVTRQLTQPSSSPRSPAEARRTPMAYSPASSTRTSGAGGIRGSRRTGATPAR